MSRNASIRQLAPPADQHLFALTRDWYGMRLALVFGNHASGGQCPYYAAGKCHHCDIGAGEGAAFTSELNRQRLAWFQEHYRQVLTDVAHLVLYNSGSLLDPQEMPVDLFDEILAWARSLSGLRIVSLETRESSVTRLSVRRVVDALGPGRTARMIFGLETSDDRLRNEVLAKDMPRAAINQAVDAIRLVTADLGRDRLGMSFNILIGGPGTTSENAVHGALETASFALQAGRDANVPVDLNLHPYYRSDRGQRHFPGHPRCSSKTVALVASALAKLTASFVPRSVLFIGTHDEGHDRDSIPASWCVDAVREAFSQFNQSQDACRLEAMCRAESGEDSL